MGALTIAELFALVRAAGAAPGVDRVAVAAALAESGGDPAALGDYDPETGAPHSAGLWQLHDQGLGAGLSVAARQDPAQAAARIVPAFARWWAYYADQVGEERAVRTYLAAERPADWQNPHGAAAQRFRAAWRQVGAGAPPGALRARFLAAIRGVLGTPYRLGAKDPASGGIDCSGLLTWAARQVGVDLGDPNWTDAAAIVRRYCRPVAEAAARPGDLVAFVRTYDLGAADPDHYPTHIGAWVAPGWMLDAHAPGGVQQTYYDTPYWRAHWYGVWRPAPFDAADGSAEEAEMGRIAELEAQVAALQDQLGYWLSVVGYLTGPGEGDVPAAIARVADGLPAARARAEREAAAAALQAVVATLRRHAPDAGAAEPEPPAEAAEGAA